MEPVVPVIAVRREEDGGAVAVLVVVLMTSLLGVAALVVDLGLARDSARQAQAAVDSAALAAAVVMKDHQGAVSARTGARQMATRYLLANYTSASGRESSSRTGMPAPIA